MSVTNISEDLLKSYVASSNTWKEILQKCGYTNYGNNKYIKLLIDKYAIDISHLHQPTSNYLRPRYKLQDILVCNSGYSCMVTLKHRLIKELKWEHICKICNLKEWNSKPIPLEIDHINGIHNDNRIENLQFICPNCHAQTDTYKGKNIKNKGVKIQYKCIDCANTVYDSNSRCIKCNSIKRRVVERPEYNQLIEDSKSMSREKIANKYGVSRTSIIRWFKYYENQI